MSAALPITIWPSAPSVPKPQWTIWRRSGLREIACQQSATAKKYRSAKKKPRTAGQRTAGRVLSYQRASRHRSYLKLPPTFPQSGPCRTAWAFFLDDAKIEVSAHSCASLISRFPAWSSAEKPVTALRFYECIDTGCVTLLSSQRHASRQSIAHQPACDGRKIASRARYNEGQPEEACS